MDKKEITDIARIIIASDKLANKVLSNLNAIDLSIEYWNEQLKIKNSLYVKWIIAGLQGAKREFTEK